MSLLQQVTNEPTPKPPRVLIYSQGGVGKTTFAAGIPGVLVIPVEDGEGNLSYPRLPRPQSYDDVKNAIVELLQTEHSYRALVLDTADRFEPLVHRKVCDDRGKPTIEDFGYGKGYTFADPLWLELFRGFDALRAQKGMSIVVLAQSEIKTIEDPVIGAYDKVITKLHKRADALLYEWCDVCGYAQIERAASTKENARGREVATSSTTGRRILSLEDTGAFKAKNRYGLPPRMDLSWGALRDAIAESFENTNTNENTTENDTNEAA